VTEVRVVRSEDLNERELASLRALFADAWPEPEDRFSSDDWDHTFGGSHFVVADAAGEIVSHASVVPRQLETGGRRLATGYVEAVATRSTQRRRGLGSAVMRAANAHIDERYELGALGTGQASFYTALGWRPWRGPLAVRADDGEIPTPDEEGFVWYRVTSRTPPDLNPDAPLTCEWRPGDVW
jgi:aminoglycoside 2'-N-acetyltransferase I